jgi:hypothetical protein
MVSAGLLRRVALVRTDVSEEPGASFIRVTKIGELGTTQATQKTPFFIVTAVKTSNLTCHSDIQRVEPAVTNNNNHYYYLNI